MAYFNHAFCKAFIVSGSAETAATATSAFTPKQYGWVDGTTWKVDTPNNVQTAGRLGYFVQGSIQTNDSIGNNPGHGGYTESVKSKGINLRYVTRIGRAKSASATASTSEICLGSACAPCGQNFFLRMDVKGSPALRFLNHNAYAIGDSSGDAAANGGSLPSFLCCDLTGSTPQTHVDPAAAGAAAAQMLLADPIIKPFAQELTYGSGATAIKSGVKVGATAGLTGVVLGAIGAAGTGYAVGDLVTLTQASAAGAVVKVDTIGGGGAVTAVSIVRQGHGYSAATLATVALTGSGDNALTIAVTVDATKATFSIAEILDGTTYTASATPVASAITACLSFEGAYVSTKFGDCSFDTRDFWGKEPVQLTTSVLDMTGNPCNDCGTVTDVPGTMAQTSGEQAIRDLILTDAYMQSPYNQGNADSARIREIEGSDKLLAAIDREALYYVYYIQHSVPRFNNPTGVFDNDQYLYKIYVKSDDAAGITGMDALIAAIKTEAAAVGNDLAYNDDM